MKVAKKRLSNRNSSSNTGDVDNKFHLKRCTVNIKRTDKLIAKLTDKKTMVVKKILRHTPVSTTDKKLKFNLTPKNIVTRKSSPSTAATPSSTVVKIAAETRASTKSATENNRVATKPTIANRVGLRAASENLVAAKPATDNRAKTATDNRAKTATDNRAKTATDNRTKTATENRVVAKSATVKSDKHLLKYTKPLVATTERTRRTPKPNPKYINESMETKWSNVTNTAGDLSDSLPDISDDDDDDEDAVHNESSEEEEEEEDDIEDDESLLVKQKPQPKINLLKRVTREKDGPSPAELKTVANKLSKPTVASDKPSILSKRKIAFEDDSKQVLTKKEKARIESEIALIFGSSDDESDSSDVIVEIPKKPNLRTTTTAAADRKIEPVKSLVTRETNKPTQMLKATLPTINKPQIAAIKQPQKPLGTALRSIAPRTSTPQSQLIATKPLISSTPKPPLVKIAPKPLISSTPKATLVKTSPKPSTTPLANFVASPPKKLASPAFATPSPVGQKQASPYNKSLMNKSPKLAVTNINPNLLEDFEMMPTFTIVNINDIINQKDEVLVIENDNNADDNEIEITSDDDMDGKQQKMQSASNRRKTQHTVLSEKIAKNKKAATTSAILTLNRPPPLTDDKTKPYRNIIGGNNGKFKDTSPPKAPAPPPRILNSSLCKNSLTDNVSPVVSTNVAPRKPNEPRKFYNSTNNNNNTKTSPSSTATVALMNRSKENKLLPTEKFASKDVLVQPHPTNRRVRKITCYETWFVIKIPNEEPQEQIRSSIQLSLTRLGNDITEISLPTEQWSYKISLQKKKKSSTDEDDTDEIYTGVVQDETIQHDQRHLYSPVIIMFRRRCSNTQLRMQFDRAVIFKNETFFINMDGKNVKLLGAPNSLEYFTDIEILLKIVDDINLSSSCVEQTNLSL